MRFVRLAVSIPTGVAPAAFRVLVDSDAVEQARLLGVNLGWETVTGFFGVDGDVRATTDELRQTPQTVTVESVSTAAERGFLLVSLDPSTSPLMQELFEQIVSTKVVILTPVEYGDGRVRARFIGADATLQTLLEQLPPDVETEVRQVGSEDSIPLRATAAAGLSERQREAVEAALDLGYYEYPRRASHEDIAERLDCATSTATEHLQRAEAKVIETYRE